MTWVVCLIGLLTRDGGVSWVGGVGGNEKCRQQV